MARQPVAFRLVFIMSLKIREPIDLVLSGPNYGRNTTAVFALSSGTIGGAMEGAQNGMKSIALSYAFDSREHDIDIISEASQSQLGHTSSREAVQRLATRCSISTAINIPLRKGVSSNKILYTQMIQNQWSSGSSFKAMPENADDADPNIEEYKIRKPEGTNGRCIERDGQASPLHIQMGFQTLQT